MSESVNLKNEIKIGTNCFYELQPNSTFKLHPCGNGFIVCNPNYPPLWVRIENDGTFRSDWSEV